MQTDGYRSTRAAWARLWRDQADLSRELETLSYARAQEARSRYMPSMPAEGRLLEAGCGMGIEVVQLTSLGCNVVGVDYVEHALVPLKLAEPAQQLTAGDVHRLPFAAGSFAAYLSFGVLEHFAFGPGPALKEAHRVLRPGGILVASVPVPNLVRRAAGALQRRRPQASATDPDLYETAFTRRQLEGCLNAAGFTLIASHPIGHSFTLWGLGWPFRAAGYYRTSRLAEWLGACLKRLAPWSMAFGCLTIARK